MRSSNIREEIRVKLLLLCVERKQFRWFGHLVRIPPGRVPWGDVSGTPVREEIPLDRPRNGWRGYISWLAWERLDVPLEELVEVAWERTV